MRFRKLLNVDGGTGAGGAVDWRAGLPEDIRADESIAAFKDAGELARAFKEAQANSLRIPGENAGDDQRKAFRDQLRAKVPTLLELPADPKELEAVEGRIFEQLGRPKDSKGYALPAETKLPEGFDLAPIVAQAAEFGLTKKQFEALAKKAMTTHEALKGEEMKLHAELRQELGLAYEERVAAARATAEKFGVPADIAKTLPPGQLRVWAQVAKAVASEPVQVAGQGGGGALTPGEAAAQISEILANPDYQNVNSPRHAFLHQRRLELARIAYAG